MIMIIFMVCTGSSVILISAIYCSTGNIGLMSMLHTFIVRSIGVEVTGISVFMPAIRIAIISTSDALNSTEFTAVGTVGE